MFLQRPLPRNSSSIRDNDSKRYCLFTFNTSHMQVFSKPLITDLEERAAKTSWSRRHVRLPGKLATNLVTEKTQHPHNETLYHQVDQNLAHRYEAIFTHPFHKYVLSIFHARGTVGTEDNGYFCITLIAHCRKNAK